MVQLCANQGKPCKCPVSPGENPNPKDRRKAPQIGRTHHAVDEGQGFDTLSVNELAERASMSIGGLLSLHQDQERPAGNRLRRDQHGSGGPDAVGSRREKKNLDKLEIWLSASIGKCAGLFRADSWWLTGNGRVFRKARRNATSPRNGGAGFLCGAYCRGHFPQESSAIDAGLLSSEMIVLAQMRAVRVDVHGARQPTLPQALWALIHGRLRKSRTARGKAWRRRNGRGALSVADTGINRRRAMKPDADAIPPFPGDRCRALRRSRSSGIWPLLCPVSQARKMFGRDEKQLPPGADVQRHVARHHRACRRPLPDGRIRAWVGSNASVLAGEMFP